MANGMNVEAKAELLLRAVTKRFMSPNYEESGTAIVTAIEGLKWLTGDPDSSVDEAWLRAYLGKATPENGGEIDG